MATVAAMKPGTISYRPEPIWSTATSFHSITVAAPTTMPASAPLRAMRCQNSDTSTTGPNASPNPAQASLTRLKTLLTGSRTRPNTTIESCPTPMPQTQPPSYSIASSRPHTYKSYAAPTPTHTP